ncbi:MAG TPA: YeeE/YedE thiosulfate transporter family protein [Gemmatimonadaceae bacterium]
MSLLYALLVGVGMGWLLQRVGASNPRIIAANLRLENLTIIKFMALTIAVGSVMAYALDFFIPMHFDIKPLFVAGVLVGGLVFGIGFALSGYCPGTCVVGAAEGRKDALFVIGGGITGALLFTLAYSALEPLFVQRWNYGKVTLASVLGMPPILASLIMAAIIIAAVKYLPTFTGSGKEQEELSQS